MIFLAIYFCICEQSIVEVQKIDTGVIYQQMRSGKKFSEVVDVSQFSHLFPKSKELVDIVDNLEFPSQSCYSEIVARLKIDCNTENEGEQQLLALRFTECYYNITNRLDQFPCDVPDEDKPRVMEPPVYSIYTTMKEHLRSLCHFAKQSIFNEETSKQLINLFKSVVDSSKTIEEMNHTMNSSFISLTNSISTIGEQLEHGQNVLNAIRKQSIIFEQSVKKMADVITKPFKHIENIKMFFLMVIISFFIGFFLPEVLLPMLLLTLIYFLTDKSLGNRFEWWNDSFLKIGLKFIYFGVCLSYPLYKFSSNFVFITNFLLKFFRIKKEESVKIPRFGYKPRPQKPRCPRAY